MTKSIKYLFVFLMLAMLSSCRKDNYDAPDGGIYGLILDAEKGLPIPLPVEGSNGTIVNLIETDTDAISPVSFYAKSDGSYRNTMVFNGEYDVTFDGPFVVSDTHSININGLVELNVKALPYSRMSMEVSIEGSKISADYDVEVVDGITPIREVTLLWECRRQIDIQNGHFSSKVSTKDGLASGVLEFDLAQDPQFIKNRSIIRSNRNRIYVRLATKVNDKVNYSKVVELTVSDEL